MNNMLGLRLSHYLSFALVILALLLMPRIFKQNQAQSISQPSLPTLIEPAPIAILKTTSEAIPSAFVLSQMLSAKAVQVIDAKSGAVLFSKNAQALEYPASTTKLMTALVSRDVYQLDEVFIITAEDQTTGTVIDLQPGETLSVRELLTASLIQSANDAALTLANHYPTGYEAFIELMNQKSHLLHLDQTHFSNPMGIDEASQQTTAHDLALLAREVMKDELLTSLVGIKTTKIGTQIQHTLYNTHELLGKEGVIGVKTGTTELAGEVLITLIKDDNQEILIVLMGSQNRYAETQRLINWISNAYEWRSIEDLSSYVKR